MRRASKLISVLVCAHNEETYIGRCLAALSTAASGIETEFIVVADRCTDSTAKIAEKFRVNVVRKDWKFWQNGYAESLQTGFVRATGKYIGIVDADIAVPRLFFQELLSMMESHVASVSADVVTYPEGTWNKVALAWDRTRNIAPLGRQPFGAARLVVREILEHMKGFRDVPTPDTDIDRRFSELGYRSLISHRTKVYHLRRISPRSIINGQVTSGRGRFILGQAFARTAIHACFRCRPFVILGWLLERQQVHGLG